MTRLGWLAAALIGVGSGIAACSDSSNAAAPAPAPVDEAGAGDSGTAPDTSTAIPVISVSLEGPARVLVGDAIDVNVLIQRDGDTPVVGPVHIDFGTNADITMPAVDIAADRSSAVAKLTTSATRKHGRVAIVANASTSGATPLQGTGVFNLLVRGATGTVDNSFGTNGVFTLTQTSIASGLVTDANRVFIGGTVGSSAAIIALKEDGSLDSTFGAAGIYTTSTGAIQSTGELVGNSTLGLFLGATVMGGTHTDGVLIGATGAGVRIPNFGTNGVVTAPLQTVDRIAMAPALTGLTTKGILLAGRPDAASAGSAVVLVQADGNLSSKFGSTPLDTIDNDCPGADKTECLTTAMGSSADTTGFAHCASRKDGDIVSGRDLDDKALFGAIFTSLIIDYCTSIAVTKGFVYVAGGLGDLPVIQRYGKTSSDAWTPDALAAESLSLRYAAGIIAQADGTFAVSVGVAGNKPAFAVCRLTSSGTLDTTFATPVGCAYEPVPSLQISSATSIDSESRIVMIGSTISSNTTRNIVATRFWQ